MAPSSPHVVDEAFHSLTWLAWLSPCLAFTALSSHPCYLLLLIVVATAVRRRLAPSSPVARAWGGFLRFGIVLALFGLALALLFGGGGATVLLDLPRWTWTAEIGGRPAVLASLGGPVTLETLLWAAGGALALIAVLVALATFNALVDHYQLVRRLPRFLDRSATVVSIALAFVPEMVRAQGEIREALALRGHRLRGFRDLGPLFVALLGEGLERSMTLAESMEARGYGRRHGAAGTHGRGREILLRSALAAALALLLGGATAARLLTGSRGGAVGLGAVATGALLLLWALRRLAAGVRRSRYRREPWRRRDTLVTGASLASLAVVLTVAALQRSLLVYSPFYRARWPELSPWPLLALALLLVPLVVPMIGPRLASQRDPREAA